MNISARLSLAAGACVAVVTVIVAVAVTTAWDVRTELAKTEAASEILNAVATIRYLTLDYSLAHEPRAEVQWHRAHRALAVRLDRSRAAFAGDGGIAVDQLRRANATVRALFAELVGNRADLWGDPHRRGVADEFAERGTV